MIGPSSDEAPRNLDLLRRKVMSECLASTAVPLVPKAGPTASWLILGAFVFVIVLGYVLITEFWINPCKGNNKFNPQGTAITSMVDFTRAWRKAWQIY